MSSLEELTKDELLAKAQELGVSPANQGMTKAELIEGIEAADQPGAEAAPDQQVTTTRTKDFINRALTNTIPGTSQATDYLGRSVAAGDKDFLGRALVP